MTFKELQDEVIAMRFDESRRTSVKSWINLRYAAIWNKQDWTFKHVAGVSLAVVAGNKLPSLPEDFSRSEGIFDQYGEPLSYLDPSDWNDYFSDPQLTNGAPWAYKIVDREVYLGPTPEATTTFTINYVRRMAHVDGATTLDTPGTMVQDDDQPIWEAEYDYTLVVDACILGQQMLNDPTWSQLVPQRDELLAGMERDLARSQEGETFGPWGGDLCLS